ncbi:hypothetical protein PP175_25270 (plasmid) [Aneurinibacillus sp. Ricciae_BoGa-3]|uniref:hypothetical protein n=1 Tax=Aneurinibacillus sp. Ricciae_BoGa-3 TaxID=3022697 RepID=UPI0023426EDA|nr:hypothetical protein [Aneurinibacillus sp. Ricciae_BoGa-3]WCK57380.1 hypothetical protein PP175_25270 [Aneurinibacillus sp. Ricciae_BoGa-3]
MKLFQEIVSVYDALILEVADLDIGLFGKRKRLQSVINQAKKFRLEKADALSKLDKYVNGDYSFETEWEENKEKMEELDVKVQNHQLLTGEEIEWVMWFSKVFILKQLESIDLFFAHHFQQVEHRQNLAGKVRVYKDVFVSFDRLMERLEKTEVSLFTVNYTIQHLMELSNETKYDIRFSYQKIQRYLTKGA